MNKKKKGKKRKQAIKIERIIGCTCDTQYGLSVNPENGLVAYCAGCVVVIYDPAKNKQVRFMTLQKSITCVSFSPSGKFLAVGTKGRMPEILVYDHSFKKLHSISKPKPHYFGVRGFSWSPDEKYLLSFGNEHDRWVKLWDPKSGKKFAETRLEPKIEAVSFVSSCEFVLCGEKYVTTYSIETDGDIVKLNGNGLDLSSLKEEIFVDASGGVDQATVYCITSTAKLCMFSLNPKDRRLIKWVDLKAPSGHSILATKNYLVCGCGNGVIRLFQVNTLHYGATLPTPPPLHSHITSAISGDKSKSKKDEVAADVVSSSYYSKEGKLSVIYSDRSLFLWNIADVKKMTKVRSFLAHSGSIWSVDVVRSDKSPLPPNTFVTCADDNTIRFWRLGGLKKKMTESIARDNIFCKDLIHLIKLENNTSDSNEIRTVRFSPDGCYLASGDRVGNLRVHDTFEFKSLGTKVAHNGEILSLDFGKTMDDKTFLLATGSRDRHIHLFLFSHDRGCEHVETMSNEHQSSITCVKFSDDGDRLFSCGADKLIIFRQIKESDQGFRVVSYGKQFVKSGKIFDLDMDATQKYVVTCGQDKKLKIWDVEKSSNVRTYDSSGNAEPLRVRTCPSGIHVLASSSDKILRLYDFYSGGCYAKCRGHSEVVTGMRFTNDCRNMISVSCDGLIIIWKLSTKLETNMLARLREIQGKKSAKSSPTPKTDKKSSTAPSKKKEKSRVEEELEELEENVIDFTKKNAGKSKKKGGNNEEISFSDTGLPAWAKKNLPEKKKKSKEQVVAEAGPLHSSLSPTKLIKGGKKKNGVGGEWAKRGIETNLKSLTASVRDNQKRRVDLSMFGTAKNHTDTGKGTPTHTGEDDDEETVMYGSGASDDDTSTTGKISVGGDTDSDLYYKSKQQSRERKKQSSPTFATNTEMKVGLPKNDSGSSEGPRVESEDVSTPMTPAGFSAKTDRYVSEMSHFGGGDKIKSDPMRESITSQMLLNKKKDENDVKKKTKKKKIKKKKEEEKGKSSSPKKKVKSPGPKLPGRLANIHEYIKQPVPPPAEDKGEDMFVRKNIKMKKTGPVDSSSPDKEEETKKEEEGETETENESLRVLRKKVKVKKTGEVLSQPLLSKKNKLNDQLEVWKRRQMDLEKSLIDKSVSVQIDDDVAIEDEEEAETEKVVPPKDKEKEKPKAEEEKPKVEKTDGKKDNIDGKEDEIAYLRRSTDKLFEELKKSSLKGDEVDVEDMSATSIDQVVLMNKTVDVTESHIQWDQLEAKIGNVLAQTEQLSKEIMQTEGGGEKDSKEIESTIETKESTELPVLGKSVDETQLTDSVDKVEMGDSIDKVELDPTPVKKKPYEADSAVAVAVQEQKEDGKGTTIEIESPDSEKKRLDNSSLYLQPPLNLDIVSQEMESPMRSISPNVSMVKKMSNPESADRSRNRNLEPEKGFFSPDMASRKQHHSPDDGESRAISFGDSAVKEKKKKVRLSMAVSEYQRAIETARMSMMNVLKMYDEVDEEVRKSRMFKRGRSEEEGEDEDGEDEHHIEDDEVKETQNLMMGFEKFFTNMQNTLVRKSVRFSFVKQEKNPMESSVENQLEKMAERYSQIFMKKIDDRLSKRGM